MIYRVEHRTTYCYGSPVSTTRGLLRLLPRCGRGQRVLEARLEVAPLPGERADDVDFFGNRVTRIEVLRAHRRLDLKVVALVRVARPPPPMPELTPAWEEVREEASAGTSLLGEAPAHFLFSSPHVPLAPALTDHAARSFPEGRPVLCAALDVVRRLKDGFVYAPGSTDVSTSVIDVFRAGRGVCQDFAHVAIAGLRGLGIPARYVSGYLRTVAAPGQPRLVGADATHAWIDVWCGNAFGWVGLDPTNGVAVGDDHIVLALGRDYADVAPVAGVILAAGGHSVSVGVEVAALEEREAGAA